MIVPAINDQHTSHKASSMHLLIVDDDLDVLESIRDVIEFEVTDCKIDTASNVQQAKILAEKNKYDIALLDIKLGQDNGLDLIPVLKSIHPDMACIMMTAFRDNKYTVQAVRFGANDYLYKPVKPDELINIIARVMELQSYKREKAEAVRRFHIVFEQSTQWLFLLDETGCLLDVNQTAMDYISNNKSSIIGSLFWDSPWYEASVDAKRSIEEGFSKVKSGILFNMEVEIPDSKGQIQIYELYMKPIIDYKNEVSEVVAECRNISDRKRAEDEVKALNKSLESRVQKRTSELEQSLILLREENVERQKAQQAADKASKAKSDFLTRMSHELRTPLNAIIGFSQLLQSEPDKFTDRQNANISSIWDAGNHLLSLINEVLNLTEIESGKLEVSMTKVTLNNVLSDCIMLMEPLLQAKNIKLIDNVSDRSSLLYADHIRLKQVILNLLSNAVKYNHNDGEIIIDSYLVDNKRIRISIKDSGVGISVHDMSKLFTSFERLNTKYNVEGAGIGLVIAKNLVELMGGTIGVESKLDEGSTFWFELELASM